MSDLEGEVNQSHLRRRRDSSLAQAQAISLTNSSATSIREFSRDRSHARRLGTDNNDAPSSPSQHSHGNSRTGDISPLIVPPRRSGRNHDNSQTNDTTDTPLPPRRSRRNHGNRRITPGVTRRVNMADISKMANKFGILQADPAVLRKEVEAKNKLILAHNPELLLRLTPLPTLAEWKGYTKLPFLDDSLLENEREKAAEKVLRISHSLREFEISDSLYSVSRCDCCGCIWLTDNEPVLGKQKTDWTTREKGLFCDCQSCCTTDHPKGRYGLTWTGHRASSGRAAQQRVGIVCTACESSLKKSECPNISYRNKIYHVPVPDELRGLSFAEEAAIACVAVILNCKKLRGGVRSLKGNASFLYQDQSKMVEVLPRIPSETNIVVFKRKTANPNLNYQYTVEKRKISKALEYLIKFSPAYHRVTLSQEKLDAWPEDGFITFKPAAVQSFEGESDDYVVLVPDDTSTRISANDLSGSGSGDTDTRTHQPTQRAVTHDIGPAPQQAFEYDQAFGNTAPLNYRSMRLLDRGSAAIAQTVDPTLSSENVVETTLEGQHLDFRKYPYFFASAFPTLFVPDPYLEHPTLTGKKEIPSEFEVASGREVNIKFDEWIRCFLYRAPDARYVNHPVLKFALLNLKQRQAMLQQTRIAVRQEIGDYPVTVSELREVLNADRVTLPNGTESSHNHENNVTQANVNRLGQRILSFAGNVQGTARYWWNKKQEFSAFISDKVEKDDELPCLFHSGSFAEFHCHNFHVPLEKYLKATGNGTILLEPDLPVSHDNVDKGKLRNQLLKNLHVANWYFVSRTRKWIWFALKKGLGCTDYMFRFEFAKSRGFIHFHALLYTSWAKEFHSFLNQAVNSMSEEELLAYEKLAAEKMTVFMKQTLQLTTLHPAGQENMDFRFFHKDEYNNTQADFTTEIGSDATEVPEKEVEGIGNTFGMVSPEGTRSAPGYNPLALIAADIPANEAMMCKDHSNLVNLVMLHQCSKYCLRKKGKEMRCRFGFKCNVVEERFSGRSKQTVITQGKECIQESSINTEKGVPRLETPRNHPRMVATPALLLSSYRANLDLSPVLAANESPTPLNELEEERTDQILELRKTRSYFDKDIQMRNVTQYIVSYACKQELVYDHCLTMFKRIIAKSNDNSSVLSIGAKLGMGILRSRTIPGTECDFQLQTLPYVLMSKIPKYVWLNGTRMLKTADEMLHDQSSSIATKSSLWDKFVKRDESSYGMSLAEYIRVQQVVRKNNPGVKEQFAVYIGISQEYEFPLSEKGARGRLLRSKPYLRTLKDVLVKIDILREANKEEFQQDEYHEHYIDAFQEFLQSPEASKGMKDKYARAKDRAYARERGLELLPCEDEAPQSESLATDQSIAQLCNNDYLSVDDLESHDFNATIELEFDWYSSSVGSASDVDRLFDEWENRWHAEDKSIMFPMFSISRNPATANTEQQRILQRVLSHMKYMISGTDSGAQDGKRRLRLHVQGLAGAGKSFCIDCIRLFTILLFRNREGKLFSESCIIGCPTGCAAFNVGGATLHSIFGISTRSKQFVPRQALLKQKKFQDTFALVMDEKSMIGLKLMGLVYAAANEYFNQGKYSDDFGRIPMVILFGDTGQLPPVLDIPLYSTTSKDTLALLGTLAYKSLDQNVALLEESKRQQDDTEFGKALNQVRNGDVSVESWNLLNSRRLIALSPTDSVRFEGNATVHAFAKRADAKQCNLDYLAEFSNVISVSQYCKGTHVQSDENSRLGSAAAIPRVLLCATGCLVRLTKNLFVPDGVHMGLYNGALGEVREILYRDHAGTDTRQADHPQHENPIKRLPAWIIVEIPEYIGPPFFADDVKRKWVPVQRLKLECECFCCSRTGFPLVVQKAKTIHSFQGLTAGQGEIVRRIIAHVDVSMEKRTPNLHYPAWSRVKKRTDLAISGRLDFGFLKGLGNFPTNKDQQKEIARLREKSKVTRSEMMETSDTETFSDLLHWFMETEKPKEDDEMKADVEEILSYIRNSLKDVV